MSLCSYLDQCIWLTISSAVTCRLLDTIGHSSGAPPTVLLCDKTSTSLIQREIMNEDSDFNIDTLLELVCNSGVLTTRQIRGKLVAGTHRPKAKNPSLSFYERHQTIRPIRFVNIGTGILSGASEAPSRQPFASQSRVSFSTAQESDTVTIQMKALELTSDSHLHFDRFSASKGQISGPESDKHWKGEEVCELTATYLARESVVQRMAGLARVLAETHISRGQPQQTQEAERAPSSACWEFITGIKSPETHAGAAARGGQRRKSGAV